MLRAPLPPPVRARRALLAGAALLSLLPAGCGAGKTAAPSPQPTVAGAEPALARAPKQPGEVVIRGETSPASHGPYTFRGTYRVRFAQWSPEAPAIDFAHETPFTVALDLRPDTEEPGSVHLFGVAGASATKQVRIDGRYYVDVGFGDFPYVIRFRKLR